MKKVKACEMQAVAQAKADQLKAIEDLKKNSGLHDKKTGKKLVQEVGDP